MRALTGSSTKSELTRFPSASNAARAHAHGHLGAQPFRRRLLAAAEKEAAERSRAGGEDDVVDRPAERPLDLLQLLELDGHGRHPPGRSDLPVDARPRRGGEPSDDELGQRASARTSPRGGRDGAPPRCRRRRAREQGTGTRRPGRPPERAAGHRAPREPAGGSALGVEHQAGDEGAAHAVHQAVVDLARERPAAVGQPVDR